MILTKISLKSVDVDRDVCYNIFGLERIKMTLEETKRWLLIDRLPLRKILSAKEYEIITALHGFKNKERISLDLLSKKMNYSKDKIMDIHSKAILKIMGYNSKISSQEKME